MVDQATNILAEQQARQRSLALTESKGEDEEKRGVTTIGKSSTRQGLGIAA
jgi:hypothetical protein